MTDPSSPAGSIIHPAYELRRDLIAIGFTVLGVDEEKHLVVENRLRVIRLGRARKACKSTAQGSVKIGSTTHWIDNRYNHPPRAKDQWSESDIADFLGNQKALKGPNLYRELKSAVMRHADLGEEGAYVIVAVWPLLSFTYLVFPAVLFLLFLGPKETGKTQTLDLLARLCRCGHKSRPTAASLGDMIESQRATWLIDQANHLKYELREILVDSYRAGASRTITDMDQRGRPHRFETYAPKAFAAHANFDEDLLDRCVLITMVPAARAVEQILAHDGRLDVLRWQSYHYVVKHFPRLFKLTTPEHRAETGERLGLNGRQLELWWPMEVLFEWLEIPKQDREAARAFFRNSTQSTKAMLPQGDEALLRTLAALANGRGDTMELSRDELEEALMASEKMPPSASWLGRRLRDQSLVLGSRRERSKKGRPTVWRINLQRLEQLCSAWKIEVEDVSGG